MWKDTVLLEGSIVNKGDDVYLLPDFVECKFIGVSEDGRHIEALMPTGVLELSVSIFRPTYRFTVCPF